MYKNWYSDDPYTKRIEAREYKRERTIEFVATKEIQPRTKSKRAHIPIIIFPRARSIRN
jgi:hypothetical protein